MCLSFITRGKKKKEESKVHRRQTKETRRRLLRACVDDHTHQKQKLKKRDIQQENKVYDIPFRRMRLGR